MGQPSAGGPLGQERTERDTTKVTIITVTRNNAEGLRRTLDSLVRQSLPSHVYECLVIDGASNDHTSDVVRSFPGTVDLFLSEPDQGPYDAMNKGIDLAKGEWLQFLNAGDTLASGHALERAIEILDGVNPQLGWAIGQAHHMYGGQRDPAVVWHVPHQWWKHALGLQPHVHQACFFSRQLLVGLAGYDVAHRVTADYDLILRCGLLSSPAVIPSVVAVYEGGGMSAQAGDLIPHLLHAARVERLQLTGAAAVASRLYASQRVLRTRLDFRRRILNVSPRRVRSTDPHYEPAPRA